MDMDLATSEGMRPQPSSRAGRNIPREMQSAKAAGLRYVADSEPGIRRIMGTLGFRYIGPDGRTVRAEAELKRIRALAVPPAWTEVWICRDARGHLQATGRDAKGRKQYRYHANWHAHRGETKFDRMTAFAAALPVIRARTEADLARTGLPRDKVLAAVVQLLEKSLIRVGNEEYARQNHSFGLTTLQDKHVDVRGGTLKFEFRGKSGVKHCVHVDDRRLARIVRQCRDLPGQDLFQYIDDEGRRCDVTSGDVNAYLKRITGQNFTAKDFRTWAGTVLCATALEELDIVDSPSKAKRNVLKAIEAVAGVLGNTRAVCRKSYIHPAVMDAYMDGKTLATLRHAVKARRSSTCRALRPEESAVVRLLEQGLEKNSRRKKVA
jgi:DNA topoisomerase-1